MKPLLFVLLGFLGLALLGGCRPPDVGGAQNSSQNAAQDPEGVRVSLELPETPAIGPAELLVYVLESNEGVADAQVTVTGHMTHAGMEPVIADAVESEPGLYRTQDFAFDMAGDWLLTAEVTLPSGDRATADVPLTVPGS